MGGRNERRANSELCAVLAVDYGLGRSNDSIMISTCVLAEELVWGGVDRHVNDERTNELHVLSGSGLSHCQERWMSRCQMNQVKRQLGLAHLGKVLIASRCHRAAGTYRAFSCSTHQNNPGVPQQQRIHLETLLLLASDRVTLFFCFFPRKRS